MKLDPRIEKISDILTCTNVKEAEQFIGQGGYFTNTISRFDNLNERHYGVLACADDCDLPFRAQLSTYYWRYFIPECRLKPKKKQFRPYTLEEFLNQFPLLTTITMRKNGDNDCILTLTFTGYRIRLISIDVCLGVEWISLGALAKAYEYKNDSGEWLPFEVEERVNLATEDNGTL